MGLCSTTARWPRPKARAKGLTEPRWSKTGVGDALQESKDARRKGRSPAVTTPLLALYVAAVPTSKAGPLLEQRHEPYAAECVEVEFLELRDDGVLGGSGCHIETQERAGSLYHRTPAQER